MKLGKVLDEGCAVTRQSRGCHSAHSCLRNTKLQRPAQVEPEQTALCALCETSVQTDDFANSVGAAQKQMAIDIRVCQDV